jgi:hypothetical protein
MANTARIAFAPPFRRANYVVFGPMPSICSGFTKSINSAGS